MELEVIFGAIVTISCYSDIIHILQWVCPQFGPSARLPNWTARLDCLIGLPAGLTPRAVWMDATRAIPWAVVMKSGVKDPSRSDTHSKLHISFWFNFRWERHFSRFIPEIYGMDHRTFLTMSLPSSLPSVWKVDRWIWKERFAWDYPRMPRIETGTLKIHRDMIWAKFPNHICDPLGEPVGTFAWKYRIYCNC
jgi:hypothetical protein